MPPSISLFISLKNWCHMNKNYYNYRLQLHKDLVRDPYLSDRSLSCLVTDQIILDRERLVS